MSAEVVTKASGSSPIRVGFIGGGNMAEAIIRGLLCGGWLGSQILVSDPVAARRVLLGSLGVQVYAETSSLAGNCDVLVVAVKPQVIGDALAQLEVDPATVLVISIAAGVRLAGLAEALGWGGRAEGELRLVRAMPNTPALVSAGATALYSAAANPADRSLAESILSATGLCLWVASEADLDVVTALSGSGPAYFFLLMEAMVEAAEELGLDGEQARLLTLQTAFGSARLAQEEALDPAVLRARVTSPGGTTAAALEAFAAGDLRGLVREALSAAWERSRALSEEL